MSDDKKRALDTAQAAWAACDRMFSDSGLQISEVAAAMAHVETLNGALQRLALSGVKRSKIVEFVSAWAVAMDAYDEGKAQ